MVLDRVWGGQAGLVGAPRRLQRPPSGALSSEPAAVGSMNSGHPASPGLCRAARRFQQQERWSSASQGILLAKLVGAGGAAPPDPPGDTPSAQEHGATGMLSVKRPKDLPWEAGLGLPTLAPITENPVSNTFHSRVAQTGHNL